jgi:hypothetical protein
VSVKSGQFKTPAGSAFAAICVAAVVAGEGEFTNRRSSGSRASFVYGAASRAVAV